MNYKKHYNLLVEKAILNNTQHKSNYEKHHIIPSSLGGSNDIDNLVLLTPKEHFIAHFLLLKIYKKEYILNKNNTNYQNYKKIFYAFRMMCTSANSNKRNYLSANSNKYIQHRNNQKKSMQKLSDERLIDIYNYFVENQTCDRNKDEYIKLQKKFEITISKKNLKLMFKLRDLNLETSYGKLTKNKVEIIFNDFDKTDKSKKSLSLIISKYNENISTVTMMKYFTEYGFVSKIKPITIKEKLENIKDEVFQFYADNDCSYNESNYNKLQDLFGLHDYTKEQVLKQLNRYGLRISDIVKFKQKIKVKITDTQLINMISYYKENVLRNKNGDENYKTLQKNFFYNGTRKAFLSMINSRGFSVTK